MIKRLFIFIIFFIPFTNITYSNGKSANNIKFIENKGQWEDNIRYKTFFTGGYAFVEDNGIMFLVSDLDIMDKDFHSNIIVSKHAFKIELINSKPRPGIIPRHRSDNYHNYYLGNDPSKWKSEVYEYSNIVYTEVYPNIDWKLFSENNNIKHEFIVKKGGNIQDIRLRYNGIEKPLLRNGNLVLNTNIGEIIESKPIAYQIIDNKRIDIEVGFRISKDSEITYDIGDYDPSYELIIDPELIFSTYSGSYSDNWGFCATYDRKGNAYMGGITDGSLYPTTIGAYDQTFHGGGWDISISKISSDGTTLLYSTYLGSSSSDMPHSMIVNEFGELIVLGTTGGEDFPTTANAYQTSFSGGPNIKYARALDFYNGVDIFVSKFNESGTELLGSTYVGGTDNDGINYTNSMNTPPVTISAGNDSLYANYGDGARGEIITDDQNNVYIGSCTFSSDFPTTPNAFQPNHGGKQDGVVFKLDYALSNLLFSSYIGGSEADAVYSTDTDSEYKLYVTGGTVSHDFPTTTGAYSTSFNGGTTDGFLSLISYDGTDLIASTYYGSDNYDQSYFVRTDNEDHPHIFGQTRGSGTSLIHNADYSIANSGQFIAKFTPTLNSLVWGTVFGNGNGRKNISPTAFMVDICGRIYASGWGGMGELTTHNFEVTNDAYQSTTDNKDFYIMCMEPDASALIYATYFGENSTSNVDHVDGGTSRFDKFSTLYQTVCAGCGMSDNFPTTPGVVSSTNNSGNCNAALFKFNVNNDFPIADFDYPNIACAPTEISFINNSRAQTYYWDFGDGESSSLENPSHIYTQGGIYDIVLIAYDPDGCITSDTITQTLIVLENATRYLPDLYICENLPIQIGIDPLPSSDEVSFTWHPSHLLNDSTITNPIARVDQDTEFMLIVTDGVCHDTIIQNVLLEYIELDIQDTVHTCNSPYNLNLGLSEFDSIFISSDRRFVNILNNNPTDQNSRFGIDESGYIYVKLYKNGCYGIDSVMIVYSGVRIELITTDIRCASDKDGRVVANVSMGTSPYQFEWSNGISGEGINTLNNLESGDYTLIVIDKEGCENHQEFSIDSPPLLEGNIVKKDNNCDVCQGVIELDPSGGVPPYSIEWEDGGNESFREELCSGNYSLKIEDGNKCEIDTVVRIENLDIFYDFWVKASETTVYSGKEITLTAKHIEDIYYQWFPASVESPNSHITRAWPQETITYYVVAKDNLGCETRGSIKIDVENIVCGEPNIFVPNIFTPNGDGVNDEVGVEGKYIKELFFIIFDRWGEEMFSTRNQDEKWDGKHRGIDCMQGVYYYRLDVICDEEQTYSTSGDITLIR